MNRVQNLIRDWERSSLPEPTVKVLKIQMGAHDYARLCALKEVYAGRTEEQLVKDLMSTVLDEVEETLPYIQGSKFMSEVELGIPISEDREYSELFDAFNQKYSHAFEEKQRR